MLGDDPQSALQAWDLGAQELQLQAWGDTAGKLFSVGLDLAAIDAARVVVKLPITAEGVEAAAYLKDRNVRVTLTGARATRMARWMQARPVCEPREAFVESDMRLCHRFTCAPESMWTSL